LRPYKTAQKHAADGICAEMRTVKKLEKSVFKNDSIASQNGFVILCCERTQSLADGARGGPTGCSARGPEGRWPRFSFVSRFVFFVFFDSPPQVIEAVFLCPAGA